MSKYINRITFDNRRRLRGLTYFRSEESAAECLVPDQHPGFIPKMFIDQGLQQKPPALDDDGLDLSLMQGFHDKLHGILGRQ